MKNNHLPRILVCTFTIIALIPGLALFSADTHDKRPVVKKGAEVIIIKGIGRSWRDVNKTPLHQRQKPRKMRPVLNFERELPIVKRETEPDPVVQRTYTGKSAGLQKKARLMPTPDKSFNGMNFISNGAGWPPDTTGDVGQTYYVQAVNTSIGIYRKSDGALVSATTYDDFFEGGSVTGTPCDENNNGDPLVLYDQYSQRWFILDFAWDPSETDGSYYSIAVSKTGDPTGDWWLYAFRADNTLMNDYPKAGIWHDGIYITANMFQFTGGFQGVKVWALKKPDIYNGTLVAQTVYDTSWYAWSILPSNAKGSTPPSPSAPNYMYSYDADEWGYSPSDVLVTWKYDVDWNNSANTTWTGPTTIPTAAFSLHSSNIPQQGTSYTLDTLYSRFMYSSVYRNFSSYESVYLSHVVDVGGVAATRWYEVRISGGSSSIYQQGTYAPDSHHRWMGSIAADKEGNIAVGYSVSSSSLYPSIRYAGRLSTDPLGELSQGEASMVEGGGYQMFYDRWGDYSTMSIDPTDDETFWYTQEYYATLGTNWQTRIGAFKLASGSSSGVIADLNGDGNVDILWRYYGTGGYNAVWLRGTGGSAPLVEKINVTDESAPTNRRNMAMAMDTPIEQLRKRGIIDGFTAVRNANRQISNRDMALSVSDPRSDPESRDLPAAADVNWQLCGSGDFNNDGNIDLVWRNNSSGKNAVWLMDGVTRLTVQWLPTAADIDWKLCGTGDFNNDDKIDLVWRNTADGKNALWFMDGLARTTVTWLPTAANTDWKLCGTGDFNNDGEIDLVWRNTADGKNAVWFMDGITRTGVSWLPTAANTDWTLCGCGDFNNDNQTDLLWQHLGNGKNAVWYMNGINLTGVEFITTVTNTTWRIEN